MNEIQKAEFRATIAGNFGYLSAIFDENEIIPSVAEHAYSALQALLKGNSAVLEQYQAEFSAHQILDSILSIRRIIDHPCPQNRRTGATDYYTVYTDNGAYVGEPLLINGIDEARGVVYWHKPDENREERHEKIGILGLTAKQSDKDPILTKEDLLTELNALIQESYITYLESRTQQSTATTQAFPQLEFSPTQITCQLTNKIFHTPVVLFTFDSQRSGIVEKERALMLLQVARSNSEPPSCPFTRKLLRGYIVCTATQAMANQFWEKYQSGNYSQEFERFIPNAATLSEPDCLLLSTEEQQPRRSLENFPRLRLNPRRDNNFLNRLLTSIPEEYSEENRRRFNSIRESYAHSLRNTDDTRQLDTRHQSNRQQTQVTDRPIELVSQSGTAINLRQFIFIMNEMFNTIDRYAQFQQDIRNLQQNLQTSDGFFSIAPTQRARAANTQALMGALALALMELFSRLHSRANQHDLNGPRAESMDDEEPENSQSSSPRPGHMNNNDNN